MIAILICQVVEFLSCPKKELILSDEFLCSQLTLYQIYRVTEIALAPSGVALTV